MFYLFGLQHEQQPQLHQEENAPNAFDLTWRNYLPSTILLFSCLPSFLDHQCQEIRLNDDDNDDNNTRSTLSPTYYNDFYQTSATDNYHNSNYADLPSTQQKRHTRHKRKLGTRKSIKGKKHRQRQLTQQLEEPYNDHANVGGGQVKWTPGGLNHDGAANYYRLQQKPTACEIYLDDDYQDAKYLDDDNVAKSMIQYSKHVTYLKQQHQQDESSTCQMDSSDYQQISTNHDQQQQHTLQDENEPEYLMATAAQAIFSEKLENLTEKLAFIRNNMTNIGTSATPLKTT